LRVLWLDAHADINDHTTSVTGNLHGMPLGYHYNNTKDKPIWNIENKRIKSNQLYYYGIRDLDPAEIDLILNDKIGFSTQIDNPLVDFIQNAPYLAISFDVDVLDPIFLDSTGTLAENGATPAEIKTIFDIAQKKDSFVHLDIVEINPLLGDWDKSIQTLDLIFH
jgi:arginase